jgi:hypothetical protein
MNFVEETDTRFYIQESTLPNAGYGCFANTFLKAGDWLEIIGVYVKTGGIADQCTHYAKRYKFAGSPKQNAKIVPMGYGGIVNHTENPTLQNCRLEFAAGLNRRSQDSGQVIYRFIRDIAPGEELIGNYGPDIGEEINKMNTNLGFLDANITEINRFLKFDLYDTNSIVDKLRKVGIE